MGTQKTAKPSGKKNASTQNKTTAKAATAEPEVTGSQADHERFLDAAKALDARDVRPYRLDPSLAYHNVQRGVEAVLALEERVRKELPAVHVEHVRTLPNLALGLCFAASQVDRGGGSNTQAMVGKAYALREKLLATAVALATSEVLPLREVEKIQEGRGAFDAAQDCVDLAALFKKHAAAVRGKSPISAAQIAEAAELGTELLKVLRPKSAKKDRSPTGALKEAINVRDRQATLLAERHEVLRRVGYWLWGDAFDKHVPALQARAVKRKKTAAAEKKEPEKKEPEKKEP